MKNLKKVCALVLSLAMIVSTFTVSFAAEDTMTDADKCAALGMLKGDGDEGVTDEYLAKSTTRFQAALMVLRLQDLEDEAMAFEGTETFADAEDLQWVAGRSVLAYLKANPELGWLGNGETFDPNGPITAQAYYKVMLEAIGYKQGTDFEWVDTLEFAAEKGLKAAADVENFTNNEIAVVTVETLNAETKDGEKLIDVLVEAGAIDKEKAVEVGLVEAAPAEVAIKSAVALNSKVVEVVLTEAAEEVDAAQFAVTDKDAEALEVESAKLAEWDTENKTVLVTLADETKNGELYTVASGETKANFGGRKADTNAPEVSEAKSNGYNEAVITFSEAVEISTVNVKITKKYGDKAELSVLDMKYDGSDSIVLTTEDQDDVLYQVKVTKAADFAGNVMDDDDSNTFVGEERPTSAVKVEAANTNEYNEVSIKFDQKVENVDASMFTIVEKNKKDNKIEVLEARVATKNDYYGKTKIKDLNDDTVAAQYVILSVSDLKDSTLYEVDVNDIKSVPGNSLDSDKDTATFVGEAKPDKDFAFTDAQATSNTEVTLTFENKIEEATGSDIANYTIKQKYKEQNELLVTDAVVDGFNVTLTVESMKDELYEIVVANVMDIYGNKVDSDKDTQTFVGEEVADKIEAIKEIHRTGETEIRVKFDQNIGSNATDVAFYTIDGDVGYPTKVVKATSTTGSADYKAEVILTIPKTTAGKVYKLTVAKGIENNDGVVSTDELTKTFSGLGTTASLPVIEAIDTLDNQTIKIFFDRDVTSSTVKGKIWNSDHTLVAGALQVSTDGNDTAEFDLATGSYNTYAYQDGEIDTALIVRVDSTEFRATDSTASNKTFKLVANSSLVKSDKGANIVEFGYNNSNVGNPKVESIMGVNANTIRVYFTEPVSFDVLDENGNDDGILDANELDVLEVRATADASTPKATVEAITTTDNIVFEMKLDTTLVASMFTNSKAYFYIADGAAKDITNTVIVKDADTSQIYQSVLFGANYKTPDKIEDVFATMKDNRTIQVHYPEAMNVDDVKDVTNYALAVSDSSSAAKVDTAKVDFMTDRSTYDSTTNTATLYLTDSIEKAELSKHYLAIKETVMNKLGDNQIKDEYTSVALGAKGLIFEFADENDAPAVPELVSATASDDRYSLVVEFDQDVEINDSDFGTAFNGVDAAAICDALKITAQFEGETLDAVDSTEIHTVNNVSDSNYKKVQITFNKRLEVNKSGTVTTKDATSNKIATRAEAVAKVNSDASDVTFAVAPSLYPDSAKDIAATSAVVTLEDATKDTVDLSNTASARGSLAAARAAVGDVEVTPALAASLTARVDAVETMLDKVDAVVVLVGAVETAKTDVTDNAATESNINAVKTAYNAVLNDADYTSTINAVTKVALTTRINTAKDAVTDKVATDNLFVIGSVDVDTVKVVFGSDTQDVTDLSVYDITTTPADSADVAVANNGDVTIAVVGDTAGDDTVTITITDVFWGVNTTAIATVPESGNVGDAANTNTSSSATAKN